MVTITAALLIKVFINFRSRLEEMKLLANKLLVLFHLSVLYIFKELLIYNYIFVLFVYIITSVIVWTISFAKHKIYVHVSQKQKLRHFSFAFCLHQH